MPGHPLHRGPAPKDTGLFDRSQWPALRAATHDLCWLLDRGYAPRSAIELTGNRYRLTARQRMAVVRCACSSRDAARRQELQVEPSRLRGEELWLDGFNVLTLLESALAGGILLLGRDGCCRDIAGVHRRYRKVTETLPALLLVGEFAASWGVTQCHWWLDKPVSNSGRLQSLILDTARQAGWDMVVDLSFNPDRVLAQSGKIIATSDGIILNRCHRWVNLARSLVTERVPQARLLDLASSSGMS